MSQDYGNGRERVDSALLKQKAGEFGSTELMGKYWRVLFKGKISVFANHHVQSLSPTFPQRWGDDGEMGTLSFLMIAFQRADPQVFEKDIPGWPESGRIVPLKLIFIINCPSM